MLDLWYKNAVIYCLDVETFMDSNGDGIGDFGGLADRLDHIEALGATCVWLLPFYPTPNRDNGYDVTDFYVDPRLGTLGDFVAFTHAAHDRGLRVIVDLVANHTSIDHPWFQAARSDPASRYRDWYVWSKEKPEDIHEGVVFPGVQDTTWTYDEVAQAWYMHRFYKHQADLNIANPEVREELEKVMGFWLQLGVSWVPARCGAVPDRVPRRSGARAAEGGPAPLSQRVARVPVVAARGGHDAGRGQHHDGSGRRVFRARRRPAPHDLQLHAEPASLLGTGARRRRADPAVMAGTPPIPAKAQWASFLRNHDELDLGRLSDAERAEAFAAFGPEPHMQAYERGSGGASPPCSTATSGASSSRSA